MLFSELLEEFKRNINFEGDGVLVEVDDEQVDLPIKLEICDGIVKFTGHHNMGGKFQDGNHDGNHVQISFRYKEQNKKSVEYLCMFRVTKAKIIMGAYPQLLLTAEIMNVMEKSR